MADIFEANQAGLSSPAEHAAAVTPSDSADLANSSRALWVGGAGNVSLDLVGSGSAIVFLAVPEGSLLPIRAKRVRSTATTATNIVSIW